MFSAVAIFWLYISGALLALTTDAVDVRDVRRADIPYIVLWPLVVTAAVAMVPLALLRRWIGRRWGKAYRANELPPLGMWAVGVAAKVLPRA